MFQTIASEQPTDTTAPKPRIHLDYLDSLRALAALYVVVGHAVLTIWPDNIGVNVYEKFVCHLFLYGRCAVVLFITLSGFCLMLPVLRNAGILKGGTPLFLRRRAHRILPPYYFALMLSLLLIWTVIGRPTGTHWDLSIPVHSRSIALHLLLLQNLDPGARLNINGVFWSIAVEWQIYFCFPFLLWSWRKLGALPTTIVSLVLSFLVAMVLRNTHLAGLTIQFVGPFTLGMLAAYIAYRPGNNWHLWRTRLLGPLLIGAIISLAVTSHSYVGFSTLPFNVCVSSST